MAAVRPPFPWDQAIGFGLGTLRLTPTQFWSMTPRELAIAMAPFGAAKSTLTRSDFDALQQLYPDIKDGP